MSELSRARPVARRLRSPGPLRALELNARLFFQGAYLSYIALFSWLQPVSYMASKILMPLAEILFFTLLGMYATGPDTAEFYIIGNAMQLAAINGVYGVTMSVGGERWSGTLPYLFGTPANRMTIFVGRAFMHVVDGMLTVAFGFLWGVTLLGLDMSLARPLPLVLAVAVISFSTSGLGLLMGCLSLVTRNIMFVNNTVYFLLLLLSGANIAIERFPAWLQTISWSLPLTRAILAARQIMDGATLAAVSPLLLGEAAIGATYVVVGYTFFRWFETQAKQRGTLEAF